MAGVLAAVKATNTRLQDHTFLFQVPAHIPSIAIILNCRALERQTSELPICLPWQWRRGKVCPLNRFGLRTQDCSSNYIYISGSEKALAEGFKGTDRQEPVKGTTTTSFQFLSSLKILYQGCWRCWILTTCRAASLSTRHHLRTSTLRLTSLETALRRWSKNYCLINIQAQDIGKSYNDCVKQIRLAESRCCIGTIHYSNYFLCKADRPYWRSWCSSGVHRGNHQGHGKVGF